MLLSLLILLLLASFSVFLTIVLSVLSYTFSSVATSSTLSFPRTAFNLNW